MKKHTGISAVIAFLILSLTASGCIRIYEAPHYYDEAYYSRQDTEYFSQMQSSYV